MRTVPKAFYVKPKTPKKNMADEKEYLVVGIAEGKDEFICVGDNKEFITMNYNLLTFVKFDEPKVAPKGNGGKGKK